jgi:glyoxylase-like metal-dependent hydrolase (beta-lactamase superfamily II)
VTDPARWREIDDRVFVRRHVSYDLNVGLVVGDGACLVIDTREHLAAGHELAAAVRHVTTAPWTVVNTHAHFDHYLGNAAFGPADIWALDVTRDVIARYGEVDRRVASARARRDGDHTSAIELEASPVVVPTHGFTAPSTTLDVGGRPVTLHHLGRGHTDNDTVITVDDATAVFAGDLVEDGAPPAFEDAFPIEWVATLGALLPLLGGPVVPGHGDVVDAAFVAEQRALLERVAAVARSDAATVAGLPDDVATLALTRARAELIGEVHRPTPEEVLGESGLGSF